MSDEHQLLDEEGAERPLAIPAELPVLPLRDTVLFPNSFMPLAVARESSVRLIEEAIADSRLVGVFTQLEPGTEDPTQEDLYFPQGVKKQLRRKSSLYSTRVLKSDHRGCVFKVWHSTINVCCYK